MPRPKNKEELLAQSNLQSETFLKLVEQIKDKNIQPNFKEEALYKSVNDVVAHLHYWHLLFLKWYEVGMKGEKPEMPEQGYTWKTVPALNRKIWEEYKNETLEVLIFHFNKSYLKIQELIESHTQEELFTKKKYKWTGSTSLGSYLISATTSHYSWAVKYLKKAVKGQL